MSSMLHRSGGKATAKESSKDESRTNTVPKSTHLSVLEPGKNELFEVSDTAQSLSM
jgi:hypothetical protein